MHQRTGERARASAASQAGTRLAHACVDVRACAVRAVVDHTIHVQVLRQAGHRVSPGDARARASGRKEQQRRGSEAWRLSGDSERACEQPSCRPTLTMGARGVSRPSCGPAQAAALCWGCAGAHQVVDSRGAAQLHRLVEQRVALTEPAVELWDTHGVSDARKCEGAKWITANARREASGSLM